MKTLKTGAETAEIHSELVYMCAFFCQYIQMFLFDMISCLCPGALQQMYLFSVMFWGATEIKHNTEAVINILRAFLRINQILSNVYLRVWWGCDYKNNLKAPGLE